MTRPLREMLAAKPARALMGSLLALSTGLFAARTEAATAMLVQVPASMDASLAESRTGTECRLGEMVGANLYKAIAKRAPESRSAQQIDTVPADMLGLKLTIVSAVGGNWSNSKSLMVRAELMDANRVQSSQTFFRQSKGSIKSPLMGACEILEDVAADLGEEVARWASNPRFATKADAPALAGQ